MERLASSRLQIILHWFKSSNHSLL